jgi:hypothetical protein
MIEKYRNLPPIRHSGDERGSRSCVVLRSDDVGFRGCGRSDGAEQSTVMNLSIHSGTVVCPQHGKAVEAEACCMCRAFHGTSRANASVICLPGPGSAGPDAKFWAPFLAPKH